MYERNLDMCHQENVLVVALVHPSKPTEAKYNIHSNLSLVQEKLINNLISRNPTQTLTTTEYITTNLIISYQLPL